MTSIYTESVGLMQKVLEATKDMENGTLPGLYEMRSLHGKLVGVHGRLAQCVKPLYKAHLGSYVARQLAQATQYKDNRERLKMTAADSDKYAKLAVGDELDKETENESEYKGHDAIMWSLSKAIDFCDRVCSDIKYAEGKPSPPIEP